MRKYLHFPVFKKGGGGHSKLFSDCYIYPKGSSVCINKIHPTRKFLNVATAPLSWCSLPWRPVCSQVGVYTHLKMAVQVCATLTRSLFTPPFQFTIRSSIEAVSLPQDPINFTIPFFRNFQFLSLKFGPKIPTPKASNWTQKKSIL